MADSRFFTNKGPFSLKRISEHLNCNLIPPKDNSDKNPEEIYVQDLNKLESATAQEITFFSNNKYLAQYTQTNFHIWLGA